ncbi:MAG: tetratricopeptide repeat protein [Chloroflexi bacterium]|nr:tetratricopeptide repeat protein [Chloroflexota bacterium]
MTLRGLFQPSDVNPFDERVEFLCEELQPAIQWNRPAIVLAVCDSEPACADAELAAQTVLTQRGQRVVRIEINAPGLLPILRKFQTSEGHIFFLQGSSPEQREILAQLSSHTDILTRKRIRLVIWIAEHALAELARSAPEIWTARQSVIEFPTLPNSPHVLENEVESAWNDTTRIQAGEQINAHLREPAEKNPSQARLTLTLGILNWRKGDHEKAGELLQDAIKTAAQMEDNLFEAECFNALALVKFAQGKNDEAIDAYKQAIDAAPEQLSVWNNLGKLCLKIGRNDEAMLAFQKTIERNPNDPIAWNGLGNVYQRIGYIKDSITAYRKAIEYAPTLATPWAGLGDALAQAGRDADAIAAYQKAVELKKDFSVAWLRLAEMYSKNGRDRDAIKTYQRALAVDPKDSLAWNSFGLALLNVNEYEDAMRAFLNAIELDRSFGAAYLNLSLAYANQGMILDAITACKQSLQLFTGTSDKINAWERLANFYRAVHDYEDAMQAYQTADALKGVVAPPALLSAPSPAQDEDEPRRGRRAEIEAPTPAIETATSPNVEEGCAELERPTQVYPMPAWILNPDPNHPKEEPMNTQDTSIPAQQAFSPLGFSEGILPPDPFENAGEIAESKDPEVWNEMGNIHFQKRDHEKAIAAYHKAIELDRSFGWPYYNLAHAYLSLGKYTEAILLYRKSASLLAAKEEKAAAWNSAGDIHRHLNQYEDALDAYQQADELDPQNAGRRDHADIVRLEPNSRSAQVWLELGNLLFKSGSYNEAANAFAKAIQIDPASGWAHSNLAMSYVFQGRHAEAVSVYLKSIDLFHTHCDKAISWNRLGNVYRKMNDEENARKAYQIAASLSNEKANLLTRARFSLLGNCYAN